VWRGTDNWPGWISDADFKQIALPWSSRSGPLVHKGFYHDYINASADMYAVLQTAMSACPSCSITVAGHSLGGALAVLCATDLAGIVDRSIKLMTYGQPRVFDPAAVAWFVANRANVTVQRHVWTRDLVPHVPPQSFPFVSEKYHHLPFEIFTPTNNNAWRVCDSSGEDAKCSDSFSPFFNPLDHALYFNVDILTGIPHGCLYTDPSASLKSLFVQA